MTTLGTFTTKSLYDHLINPDNTQPERLWDLIWRAPAQQRARQFMYLLSYECLLTNEMRARRHLTNFASCPRCGETETCFHMIRDCPLVTQLWRVSLSEYTSPAFFTVTHMKNWITVNLSRLKIWSSHFVTTCWYIWKARNNLSFNNLETIRDVPQWSSHMVRAFWEAERRKKSSVYVVSKPIPKNWVRFCLASHKNMVTGSNVLFRGGGLLVNDKEQFLMRFTVNGGFKCSLTTIIQTIMYGLDIAQLLGLDKIIFMTYDKQVIPLLTGTPEANHPLHMLIEQCRSLVNARAWSIQFIRCSSVSAKLAHLMAESGLNSGCVFF